MKRLYVLTILVILSLFLLDSCTKFDESITPVETPATATRSTVNPAALRLSAGTANVNNPYSLANMQKARNQLATSLGSTAQLSATHEYVRFLPQDTTQLYILNDLGLVLFDFPIDRRLTDDEREFYINDKTDSEMGWRYTVVPKGFSYPTGIRKEVMQDLYYGPDKSGTTRSERQLTLHIIGGGGGNSGRTSGISDEIYKAMVERSMKNTGEISAASSVSSKAWIPVVQLNYEDGYVHGSGLENVTISVTDIHGNIGFGKTDRKGRAVISSNNAGDFIGPVTYKASLENDNWEIMTANGDNAVFYSPEMEGTWNRTITFDENKVSAWAAVHRAFNHIFHYQQYITIPYRKAPKLKSRVYWNEYDPDKSGLHIGPLHLIKIWCKDYNGDYVPRRDITTTTLHELGHASHRKKNASHCNIQGGTKLGETFAEATAVFFRRQMYDDPKYSLMRKYHDAYTAIGESMLNQGVSLTDIQETMVNSDSWTEWQQNFKQLFTPSTRWIVELVFANRYTVIPENLKTESIYSTQNSNIDYKGQTIRYELANSLIENGVKAIQWIGLPTANCEITNITDTSADYIFNKAGTYTVKCLFQVNENTTYEATKTIVIRNKATIRGNKSPRLGVLVNFGISDGDDDLVNKWEIYNSKQVINDHNDLQVIDNENADSVVFYTPGEYKVKALIRYGNGEEDLLEYPVTVRSEGEPYGGIYKEPAIYPVYAYKNTKTGAVNTFNMDNNTVEIHYTDQVKLTSNPEYYFRTFSALPPTDHPYYNDLQPIYMHHYDNGKKALGKEVLYDANGNKISSQRVKVQYYLLKKQWPGTIPIYDMEVTTGNVHTGGLGGGPVRINVTYRIISPLNKTGTIIWAGEKTTYTNLGIVGYAYPY